jgi:hypothetical protein
MFDSNWIDIAIGVVFVWFVFALFVTLVNESITRLLALRSKQMWQALNQLLDGNQKSKTLIRSALTLPFFSGRPADPDPARASTNTEKLYATSTIQGMENRTLASKKTRISNIPTQVFSQALIELGVREAGANGTISDFVTQVPDTVPLGPQLKAIWNSVNNDVKEFRVQVERWFDGQMTRLSAAYKARVRYFLVPLGIIVAIVGFGFGLRTDALALVGDVQHDQNFRALVVGAATSATRDDLAKVGCPKDTPEEGNGPGRTRCEIDGVAKLSKINLVLQTDAASPKDDFAARLGVLFSHWRTLVGVLITGLAISFGSTFWFDALRRLVGIRSGSGTAGS